MGADAGILGTFEDEGKGLNAHRFFIEVGTDTGILDIFEDEDMASMDDIRSAKVKKMLQEDIKAYSNLKKEL